MKKEDELLSHNYDGIQEYDNSLPKWWRWLFYVTMILSAVYVVFYHFGPGENQEQILAAEMQAVAKVKLAQPDEVTEEQLLALVSRPEIVEQGRSMFQTRCLACHGAQGQGIVGPNLTDDYWIHGGKLLDIRKTIREGVIAKGMIAWKDSMTEAEIRAVIAYVRSIAGTNPPGAKAAEGERYAPQT